MTGIGLWRGRPIEGLPREELLEIIEFLAGECKRLSERPWERWR